MAGVARGARGVLTVRILVVTPILPYPADSGTRIRLAHVVATLRRRHELTLLSRERWDAIYGVPAGDVTIERVQHALYMAANYGFQILNGNFAAAIDDYELHLRFMNDLATYRIDVSWLWTLLHHQARVTKDGWLKGPRLTDDGVVPAANVSRSSSRISSTETTLTSRHHRRARARARRGPRRRRCPANGRW